MALKPIRIKIIKTRSWIQLILDLSSPCDGFVGKLGRGEPAKILIKFAGLKFLLLMEFAIVYDVNVHLMVARRQQASP